MSTETEPCEADEHDFVTDPRDGSSACATCGHEDEPDGPCCRAQVTQTDRSDHEPGCHNERTDR